MKNLLFVEGIQAKGSVIQFQGKIQGQRKQLSTCQPSQLPGSNPKTDLNLTQLLGDIAEHSQHHKITFLLVSINSFFVTLYSLVTPLIYAQKLSSCRKMLSPLHTLAFPDTDYNQSIMSNLVSLHCMCKQMEEFGWVFGANKLICAHFGWVFAAKKLICAYF